MEPRGLRRHAQGRIDRSELYLLDLGGVRRHNAQHCAMETLVHRQCRRSEEHTSELQSHSDLVDLHSFPTRRSSDLGLTAANCTCSIWEGVADTMRNIAQWKRWFTDNAEDRKSTRLNSSHTVIS